MKIDIEPIRNWFGYSRRERRSSAILLLILVIVILVRYVVPESRINADDVTSIYVVDEEAAGNGQENALSNKAAFSFNPNTASFDTLIRLGLTEREAGTLISYRTRGESSGIPLI